MMPSEPISANMTVNAQVLRVPPAFQRELRSAAASRAAGAAGLVALAAAVGAAAALNPPYVVGAFGLIGLAVLAFRAPVVHLTILLIFTAVVGYSLQHKLGSHLLPSDAMLLTGLLRASVTLMRQRLERRRLAVLGLMLAFSVATILQVAHGIHIGANFSESADEGRDLLGFATLLIAMPILDDPAGRRRLGRGLVVTGLLLGFWGLTTWASGISLGQDVDVGLRTTAGFATAGNGQLHGGLYGYPVAVIMAATVLLAGHGGQGLRRWSVTAVLAANLMCLVLTYERTFWLTTIATLGFVVAKMRPGRRLRAAVAIAVTAVATLGLLATVFPKDLNTIAARALTLGQPGSDDSVRSRLVETRHMIVKVKARPLQGWGLGDTLYWGQPWRNAPPQPRWFAHNGYLWVIWKVGAVVAMLLFVLLVTAIGLRAPPERDPLNRTFRVAAQGGLLVLMLAAVTFPGFNSLTITPVLGVLMAICFMPCERLGRARIARSVENGVNP